MRPTKERASHLLQQEGLQCGVQRLADVLQQDRGAGAQRGLQLAQVRSLPQPQHPQPCARLHGAQPGCSLPLQHRPASASASVCWRTGYSSGLCAWARRGCRECGAPAGQCTAASSGRAWRRWRCLPTPHRAAGPWHATLSPEPHGSALQLLDAAECTPGGAQGSQGSWGMRVLLPASPGREMQGMCAGCRMGMLECRAPGCGRARQPRGMRGRAL